MRKSGGLAIQHSSYTHSHTHTQPFFSFISRFPIAKVGWQSVKGAMVITGDYEAAVRMMGDINFLSALVNFPKEAITDETVELLQPYFAAPDFNFESAKKVRGWGRGEGWWLVFFTFSTPHLFHL